MNKKKKIQEDMLSVADSPSFQPTNIEAPGSDFQHPAMMPQPNMDKLSLAGSGKPSKSKKKKKEKETPKPASNKVLTFAEFINQSGLA